MRPFPPAILSALALLILTLGWAASRDVAAFFLGAAGLALLAVVAVGLLAKAVVGGAPRRVVGPSLVLLVASPLAGTAVLDSRDGIQLAWWALGHRSELADGAVPDRIVRHWDAWGFAGLENDLYLVRDARDDSSSLAGAERWRKRLRLGCEVVATQRMRRNFYLVTTYNCNF